MVGKPRLSGWQELSQTASFWHPTQPFRLAGGCAFRPITCMFNPDRSRVATGRVSAGDVKEPDFKGTVPANAAPSYEGPQMLEMTSENFARLLRGLTIAVGKRKNRVLLYQFLAAEIRALHCSYGLGDGESYKRALTFLENCERYTLRALVRRSAKYHTEMSIDHAKRIFLHALRTLDSRHGNDPTLRAMMVHLLKQDPVQTDRRA
jgi:hypothetical protein